VDTVLQDAHAHAAEGRWALALALALQLDESQIENDTQRRDLNSLVADCRRELGAANTAGPASRPVHRWIAAAAAVVVLIAVGLVALQAIPVPPSLGGSSPRAGGAPSAPVSVAQPPPALPATTSSGSDLLDPDEGSVVIEQAAPPSLGTVYVANTDGIGVYLRRSRNVNDRLTAWPDGTAMEVTQPPDVADGVEWVGVRTPNGQDGFIPTQYTSTERPRRPTAPPIATPQPRATAIPREPARENPSAAQPPAEPRPAARTSLENSYVLAATNARYPRSQAVEEAPRLTDAQLRSRTDRYQRESSFILAATNAHYTQSQAVQQARELADAELRSHTDRYQRESSFILAATNARYTQSQAVQQARELADAELRSRTERYQRESSYILRATNAGRPLQAAIAEARAATDEALGR
jgi:hypothetical protein